MAEIGQLPNGKITSAANSKDEAYLTSVIPKRISLFESIKAEQALHHLSISRKSIKFLSPPSFRASLSSFSMSKMLTSLSLPHKLGFET